MHAGGGTCNLCAGMCASHLTSCARYGVSTATLPVQVGWASTRPAGRARTAMHLCRLWSSWHSLCACKAQVQSHAQHNRARAAAPIVSSTPCVCMQSLLAESRTAHPGHKISSAKNSSILSSSNSNFWQKGFRSHTRFLNTSNIINSTTTITAASSHSIRDSPNHI